MQVWLRNVLNAIVELEEVPNSLKSGIIIPVYKGSGRDPVKTDSYRGVTLSSQIMHVFTHIGLCAPCPLTLREFPS